MTTPEFYSESAPATKIFSPELEVSSLIPGSTVVAIRDQTELGQFEDMLVKALPDFSPYDFDHMWRGRPALSYIIAPKRFFGSLKDIRASLLVEPYQQLEQSLPRFKHKNVEYMAEHTTGFHMQASLKSSSLEARGTISADVWIYRRPSTSHRNEGLYARRVAVDKAINTEFEKRIRKAGRLATQYPVATPKVTTKRPKPTLKSRHKDY